jgi:hypothetical protein
MHRLSGDSREDNGHAFISYELQVERPRKEFVMITEVPDSDWFSSTGLNLLNLAWSTMLKLERDLKASDMGVTALSKKYWEMSQPELSNAWSVVDQAQDFLIKSQIVAISPYLIFSDGARGWPSACHLKDTPFSEFKTISGEDLLRAHAAVAANRLDADFVEWSDDVRKRRNKIVHQGMGASKVFPPDVFVAILKISKVLYPHRPWLHVRRSYLNHHPVTMPWHEGEHYDELNREVEVLIALLGKVDLKTYFGFDKKARRYLCPNVCKGRFAQLQPNTPDADSVYCFVCESSANVDRVECDWPDCKSNVISEGQCLVCGHLLSALREAPDEPYEHPSDDNTE